MYQVSNECKTVLNSNVVATTARVTFSDPQVIIDGDNLESIKIKDYCYNEGRIIGTNIARDVEMVIINDGYDLQDKEFYLEIGVLLPNDTYEYIPYGNFIIDGVEDMKSNNKYKITAMDYMIKFNKDFVEFDESLYPMTIREFLTKFAEQYNISLGDDGTLPNEDLILPKKPFLSGINGRTVLKYLAEVFGRFAKFDRNGNLRFILETETQETISRSNMNSKLEIDNLYGEVNVVSILLSDDITGENATLRDEDSIAIYGENIIKIVGNELLSTAELRESAVTPLFNALKGFKYVPTSFNYMGKLYLDCGDRIEVQDMETNTYYESIVLNNYIEVPRLRVSKMENLALTKNSVEMQYVPEEKQNQRRTEFRVDKVEGKITQLIEQTDGNTEEISKLEISTKEIKQEVGKIEVLTSEVSGIKTITLENCIPGKLMELHIVGNNNVFKPLYLGNSTILGDNTILNGNSTIIVNSTEYELGIEEELRSNSDVSDEFILKDGKSYIVRRVDAQGQTLENEIIEQLDNFSISLLEDSNTISIKSYSANIRAVYIPHNDYNDTFATQIEMNAAIIVSADQILSTVNQAFSNYSTTTQMNSAITQKADEINSSINTAKTEAITTANNNTDTKLTEYSKTTEMNSAITQKANEITSEVSTTYSTKAETVTAKNQAISSANSSTDSKLNNYSTTSQMNSAITQKANEITSSVSETYSTKTETTNGLNEKVNNSDFGTKITQNSASVKTAWNQISENIQLETIGNNAALSIYNGTNRLMALMKDGQNFYKNGNKFGSMGVMKAKDSDTDNYGLAFVLDGIVSGNNIVPANNFMGFCYKAKDNNGNEIICPFFYLGKLQNSQYAGLHMLSDMYFEGSSIITDSTLDFKDSSDNIIFRIDGSSPRGIIMNGTHYINGLMYYNNSIINNIINTYGQSVDPGLYAITTAVVLGSNSQNRTLYLIDENGDAVWISEDSSDRKLKYDIKDTTVKALELVNKIKHRKFKWKADSSEQKIGYIAQELEEIDKNLVVKIKKDLNNESEEDENYKYQVNNVALNALSTKAIQELYMLVQNQQKQIDELQRKVEKLKGDKHG